jgi:hypothetical protein
MTSAQSEAPVKLEGKLTVKDLIALNSCSITNLPRVQNEIYGKDKGLALAKSRVNGDNREVFRELWGKPNVVYTGEFRHDVHHIEFQGSQFLIYTAAGKGTSIEIIPRKETGHDARAAIGLLKSLAILVPAQRAKAQGMVIE